MQLPQHEVAELQRWFTAVDTDRSGSIDAFELTKLSFGGRQLPPTVASQLVKLFDKNRSQNLDFPEYVILHKFIMSMQRVFVQSDQVIR
jgi:peflin